MIEKYLKTLRKVANRSDGCGGSRHASILVLGNRILSTGWNQSKTHPMAFRFNSEGRWSLCSEKHVILRSALKYDEKTLNKCTLVVARFDKQGELRPSEPCDGCKKLIEHFGIKKVYWS